MAHAGQCPRDRAADREVAREPPPARDQRRDHDEAEGPLRAEGVDEVEHRVELAGQPVQGG